MIDRTVLRALSVYKLSCRLIFWGILVSKSANLPAQEKGGNSSFNFEGTIDLNFAQKRCFLTSHDLLASRLQERAEHINYLQSANLFLPTIDISAGIVALEASGHSNVQQISISQSLYSPKQMVERAQKHLNWCRSLLQRIALQTRLLLAVRVAYFRCVLKNTIERDYYNCAKLLQSLLDQECNRLSLGRSTDLEVNQIQVSLTHALTSYLESRQATRSAENDLLSLMGIDKRAENGLQLADRKISIDNIPFLEKALASLPKSVTSISHFENDRRDVSKLLTDIPVLFDEGLKAQILGEILHYQPAMRIKKLELKNSQLAVKLQKCCFFPRVTANFLRNNIQYPIGTLINNRKRWRAQLEISYRIFDGMAGIRGLHANQLNECAFQHHLKKSIIDLRRESSERIYLIGIKLLAYCAARQGALVAKQALSMAEERYQLGQIAPLDFRQCTSQLLHANVLVESAGFDLLVAYFELCSETAEEQRHELDFLDRLVNST